MRQLLLAGAIAALLVGCGKNEPGTMGGEPATPKTVATGAPAEAARGSQVSNPRASSIESERAMSTFDDTTRTNVRESTLPQASTTNSATAQPPAPR